MHLVLFLLPLVGFFMRGMVGAVLGLTLFILCYYLMPYAWFALHGSSRVVIRAALSVPSATT